jgi:hypothetical protein
MNKFGMSSVHNTEETVLKLEIKSNIMFLDIIHPVFI